MYGDALVSTAIIMFDIIFVLVFGRLQASGTLNFPDRLYPIWKWALGAGMLYAAIGTMLGYAFSGSFSLVSFLLIIAFFLACASAFAIGEWLDSTALGFAIMGGVFVVALLILYRNRKSFIHKPILSKLSEIYFKEYPIWAIVRGVKYEENPYFKLHFKLKDGEQFDFGLMLDDNEAKEILKEIKEFLNINKLT